MSRIDKELETVDYSFSHIKKSKWVIGLVCLFLFTLFKYIPIGKKLDSLIYNGLSSIPGCAMGISDYSFEFFTPKVIIKDLSIPGRCLPSKKRDLKLKEVIVGFRGISFSPFGLSFKLKTKVLGSPIEAFIIPSITSISVLLENQSNDGQFTSQNNQVALSELSKFIPNVKLSGTLTISTAYFQFGYDGLIKDLAVNIASKDFLFPTQKIMGYKLEKLNLRKLLLQLNLLKSNKLHLKKFIIGSDKSPVISEFTGDVNLNHRNIKNSSLDIRGELKLDEKLLSSNLLLQGYLNQFDKKDKFYQIQIKGKLGQPSISSAR